MVVAARKVDVPKFIVISNINVNFIVRAIVTFFRFQL